MTQRLLIDRHDLRSTRWDEAPARALADGEVRFRIDRFALTANNITYAAFGDAMHYRDFFPSGDAASGCLPVWASARRPNRATRRWRSASVSTATGRSPTS